jgi:nitroreductase
MTNATLMPPLPAENDSLPGPAPNAALLELLATRRSTKVANLAAPAPDAETLSALLRLATRIPDHGKMAPWRFIVIGPEAGARLGEEAARIARARNPQADETLETLELGRFLRAPMVLAVVSSPRDNPKVPVWEQELSAGALCHNIALAAYGFGFAATWLTEWVAYDREIGAALGLAVSERVAGFLYMGTAKVNPQERPRPDVSALVTVL